MVLRTILISFICFLSGCSDEESSPTTGQRNHDILNQDRKLVNRLVNDFKKLEAWPAVGTISEKGWIRYIETGQLIQRTNPEIVKQALNKFIITSQKKSYSDDNESKAFLLMRVVFDLPTSTPLSELRSFKGWINWDLAKNPDSQVNLSWPVSWESKKPRLLSKCAGSEGKSYAASHEYEHFLGKYKYRDLQIYNLNQ